MKDPFAILGVTRDAPDYIVQAAYRAALKRFHPDHYSGADAGQRTEEVVTAYELIRKMRKAHEASPAESEPATLKPQKLPEVKQNKIAKTSATGLAIFVVGLGVLGISKNDGVEPQNDEGYASELEVAPYAFETASIETAPAVEDAGAAMPNLSDALSQTKSLDGMTGDQTLEYANIERGGREFLRRWRASGMVGARSYSEDCHTAAKLKHDWAETDFCAAFDYAASYFDRTLGNALGGPRLSYFEFQASNQADYYPGTYAGPRLLKIKYGAESYMREQSSAPRSSADPTAADAASDAARDLDAALAEDR